MPKRRRVVLASIAALAAVATAQTALDCQAGTASGVVQVCSTSGSIAAGAEQNFTFHIQNDSSQTIYESYDVDIEVDLTSVTGDADLCVNN